MTPSFSLAFASFSDRMDDRLNPFLVKEARQLVRSKAVVGGQWTLLAGVLVGLACVMSMAGGEAKRDAGMQMFGILEAALALVCVYGVPLYVGLRLACERTSPEGMDMLRSTSVSADAVVQGKWCSGMLVALMACSACVPFMAACYFLRGVSVGMLATALAVDLVLAAVSTQIGLFIGALGSGWTLKVLVALAAVLLSPCCAGIGVGIAVATSKGGSPSSPFSMVFTLIVLCVAGAMAWAVAYGLTLAAMVSAMRITGSSPRPAQSGWQSKDASPGRAPHGDFEVQTP